MQVQSEMERYWEWFCSIPGIYRPRQELLLLCFQNPQAVWEASEKELSLLQEKGCSWVGRIRSFRRENSPEKIMHEHRAAGIQFTSHMHPEYPGRLRSLRDRPYGLFRKGALPPENRRTVAIIGARQCTPSGREMAQRLARAVIRCRGAVISGAAYGIDGAAQWEALEAGGDSYAVLGCGVDRCYPASHRRLFERLQQQGGLISEFPAGTPPLSAHFPVRNRIISGLSDAVVIVEAKQKSGSLITAGYAADQGRQVYALPGRIDDLLSEGCNELIAQGAMMLLSEEAFLQEVFPDYRAQKKEEPADISLAPAEKLVYSSLGLHVKSLWELEDATALSLEALYEALLSLEMKGLVRETEQNFFAKME